MGDNVMFRNQALQLKKQSIQKIGNSVRQSVIVHNLAGCKEILHRKNQLSEKNDLLKTPKINLEQKQVKEDGSNKCVVCDQIFFDYEAVISHHLSEHRNLEEDNRFLLALHCKYKFKKPNK